jgi:hypothetical protein
MDRLKHLELDESFRRVLNAAEAFTDIAPDALVRLATWHRVLNSANTQSEASIRDAACRLFEFPMTSFPTDSPDGEALFALFEWAESEPDVEVVRATACALLDRIVRFQPGKPEALARLEPEISAQRKREFQEAIAHNRALSGGAAHSTLRALFARPTRPTRRRVNYPRRAAVPRGRSRRAHVPRSRARSPGRSSDDPSPLASEHGRRR